MSGTRLDHKKDKRVLVLFAFGLLLLLFDCISFVQVHFDPQKGVCQSSGGCSTEREGDVNSADNSNGVTPRLSFFLNRPMAINQAAMQDLTLLPGIGEQLAGRIIEFRDRRGGVNDASDLEEIPGIGRKMSRKISRFVTFSQP